MASKKMTDKERAKDLAAAEEIAAAMGFSPRPAEEEPSGLAKEMGAAALDAAKGKTSGLVAMVKHGSVVIHVHPDCVENHLRMGWVEAGA